MLESNEESKRYWTEQSRKAFLRRWFLSHDMEDEKQPDVWKSGDKELFSTEGAVMQGRWVLEEQTKKPSCMREKGVGWGWVGVRPLVIQDLLAHGDRGEEFWSEEWQDLIYILQQSLRIFRGSRSPGPVVQVRGCASRSAGGCREGEGWVDRDGEKHVKTETNESNSKIII